jgi:class 3 adenylate cyclase
MLLDKTCELLFQMHRKNENYQVVWTKSVYVDKPTDLDAAKGLLLKKNVIFSRQSASSTELTQLNPEVYEAKSFKEAISILAKQSQMLDSPSANSQMRQLAVILFADIEGYTRLMQRDETLAVAIREKFKKVLENKIVLHHGRIHQWAGDEALCLFTSSVEAVHAAIEIQKQIRTEPLVPLRIGVHGGDVLVKENNLYGDGVNIASRIQSFAVPGSILISKKIFDDVKIKEI